MMTFERSEIREDLLTLEDVALRAAELRGGRG